MKSNKFWIIIFSVVIMISLAALFLIGRVDVSYAQIYQDGALTETVKLSAVTEPYMISLENDHGAVNVIEAVHGRIRMASANCPDGICVQQGWVSEGITPIICLPNNVVITFRGLIASDVDAVVG